MKFVVKLAPSRIHLRLVLLVKTFLPQQILFLFRLSLLNHRRRGFSSKEAHLFILVALGEFVVRPL
jgi:hypothetical protein